MKATILLTGSGLSERGELIHLSDIPYKIKWFIIQPLRNALNLWNIFPSNKLGFFVLLIIATGIFCNHIRAMKENRTIPFMNSLLQLSLIISAIVLSHLPTLLIKESWAAYRTMGSLTTAIYILLGYAIINIVTVTFYKYSQNIKRHLITMILIIATAYACYSSYTNLKKYIVTPQIKEVEYVKNAISNYGVSNLIQNRNIYLRLVSTGAHQAKGFTFEFGHISSQFGFSIIPLVKKVLYDFGIEEDIHINLISPSKPLPENINNYLVIDMTQFNISR